ncbi:antitoxin [Clostridia bacterium]|nr:antitoxin [Clostridia bacterium]
MKDADIQRLRHIQVYCKDISAYIKRFGDDFQSFDTDSAYFDSVSMCLLQIGELANGLSQDFRALTTNRIQWNLVRGMRNWIAHAYQQVEKETIWGTVKGYSGASSVL